MATASYIAGCMSADPARGGVKSPPMAPEPGSGNSSSSIPAANQQPITLRIRIRGTRKIVKPALACAITLRRKSNAVDLDEVQSMVSKVSPSLAAKDPRASFEESNKEAVDPTDRSDRPA